MLGRRPIMHLSHLACFALLALLARLTCFAFRRYSGPCSLSSFFVRLKTACTNVFRATLYSLVCSECMQGHVRMQSLLIISFTLKENMAIVEDCTLEIFSCTLEIFSPRRTVCGCVILCCSPGALTLAGLCLACVLLWSLWPRSSL